ncbi:MAG: hypothetical protein KKG99_07255 [Bacteroidetes bacterium]|nr:hypothetical protein [Bacteroidota bacterium]
MKKAGLFFFIIGLATSAIPAQEKISINSIPSTIAFTIDEKDLFPEGITYDPITKLFFVSSVQKKKVIAIDTKGNCFDFVKQEQDSMFRSLGMKVDVERRRLWIVSNSDWGNSMISAVHIYNIDTRKLIKSLFTAKGKVPTFNDLALTESGDAFISDFGGNSIFLVPSDLSRAELFLESDNLLEGANGMVLSSDDSMLYVASNTKGIVIVDLRNKSIQPIACSLPIETKGIDGLMLYNNSLVGVFNGDGDMKKHHISQYVLSDDGREIVSSSIIDQNNPLFNEPTSGVIVDDELYCLATTNLRQFVMDGNVDVTKLKNPIVLRYILENVSENN